MPVSSCFPCSNVSPAGLSTASPPRRMPGRWTTWFAPYAGMPAVASFRQLRSSHSIGYDAAMTLAAQLDEQLAPVRPLSPLPEGLDVRWEGVDLERVLGEVRDFAAEARFDDFLAAQHDYIAAVEEAFRSFVRSRPVRDWFEGVFGPGQRPGYHVVPGLLTGLMSYGVHAGTDEVYTIMSLEAPDAGGVPTLGLLTEEYLVHEFAHAHVNSVVREHIEVFDGPAPLIDAAAPAMEQQHYLTRRHRRRGVDCQSARGALPPRRGRYRRRPPVTRDATSTRVHLDPRSGPDARDCDRGG